MLLLVFVVMHLDLQLVGAIPAKISCLNLVNCFAASNCLALNCFSASVSPGNCLLCHQEHLIPCVTTGTPVCATNCFAKILYLNLVQIVQVNFVQFVQPL